MKWRTWTFNLIASLFIFLFTYAALSKWLDFANFKSVLQKSPLIGEMNVLLAWMIPVTELILATMLFMPRRRLAGLHGSLFLMMIFTGYIGYMIAFTPDLPCSCGGVLTHLTWMEHLWFNMCFTALAATAIIIHKTRIRNQAKILLQ